MPEWILGLDGGGTKTLLVLANKNGDVLGPFVGTGVNPFDQPNWKNELEALLAHCPVKPEEIAFSSFGLPGYGESVSINAQQLEVVKNFAGENSVALNDVAVAFAGALAGKPGVLILAGTGSMAWAGDSTTETRVGGFGDGFGDEGSGYWIGQRALQKLSWTLDGRLKDERYRDTMLGAIGTSDAEGLISWFYGLEHQRSRVAALAKTVDQLADADNLTAIDILLEAANLLAAHGKTAWRKLELQPGSSISYAGSVFKSRTIRETVRHQLEDLGHWEAPIASPIAGALIDAATRAKWITDPNWNFINWIERINTTLESKISELESSQPLQ
jgi:glucosamine kinase